MTKKPKRHIRRAPFGKQVTRMTYCGRGITPSLGWCDPGDEAPTDCHWCRITLQAEQRGVRRDRWAQSEAARCAKCGTPIRPGMGDPCECTVPDK